MDSLIERFIFLQKAHGHIPSGRRSEAERISHRVAQIELYFLAQAICGRYHPAMQMHLDECRRKVIDEIRGGPTDFANVIKPKKPISHLRWTDFQITPEVSGDFSLTGAFVSRSTGRLLRDALRQQIRVVLHVVESSGANAQKMMPKK